MAIVVINDIHANDIALEAALSKIYEINEWLQKKGSKVSEIIVNGDIVGRGLNIVKTLQQLAECPIPIRYIPGNHEINMASLDLKPYKQDMEEGDEDNVRETMKGVGFKVPQINSWLLHREILSGEPQYREIIDKMVACVDCDIKGTDGNDKPGIQYDLQRKILIAHADPTFDQLYPYLADPNQIKIWGKGRNIQAETTLEQICQLADANGGGKEIVFVHGHTHRASIYKTLQADRKITIIDSGSTGWSRPSYIPTKENMTGYGTCLLLLDEEQDPTIDGQREMLVFFQYNAERFVEEIRQYNSGAENKLGIPGEKE